MTAAPSGCAGTTAASRPATLARSHAAVLRPVDAERARHGRRALRTSRPRSGAALDLPDGATLTLALARR